MPSLKKLTLYLPNFRVYGLVAVAVLLLSIATSANSSNEALATSACGTATPSLINGGFEQLPLLPTQPNNEDWMEFNGGNPPLQFLLVRDTPINDQIVGWQTTASDNYIEIQRQVAGYEQDGTQNTGGYWDQRSPQPGQGQYWAELNAYEASALFQDIEVVQGETYYWSILHRGRLFGVTDEMKVLIGQVGSLVQQTSISKFSPTNVNKFVGEPTYSTMGTSVSTIATRLEDGWTKYQGAYTASATGTLRFQFEAVSASFANRVGNLLDGISFSTFGACDATRVLNAGDVVDIDVGEPEFVKGEDYSLQGASVISGTSGTVSTVGSVVRFAGQSGGTTVVRYTVTAIMGGLPVTRTGTLTYVVTAAASPTTNATTTTTTTLVASQSTIAGDGSTGTENYSAPSRSIPPKSSDSTETTTALPKTGSAVNSMLLMCGMIVACGIFLRYIRRKLV